MNSEIRRGDIPVTLPMKSNEKRFASTHWLFMGSGGSESAAPFPDLRHTHIPVFIGT
jgi:hypothetical protein